MVRAQVKIPDEVWSATKIEAIKQKITAEELVAAALIAYLNKKAV